MTKKKLFTLFRVLVYAATLFLDATSDNAVLKNLIWFVAIIFLVYDIFLTIRDIKNGTKKKKA